MVRDPSVRKTWRIAPYSTLHDARAPGNSAHVADRDDTRPGLTAESRIALSKEQVSCDLAGEVAIVNLENGVYYGLDPTPRAIWELLAEPRHLRRHL